MSYREPAGKAPDDPETSIVFPSRPNTDVRPVLHALMQSAETLGRNGVLPVKFCLNPKDYMRLQGEVSGLVRGFTEELHGGDRRTRIAGPFGEFVVERWG